MGIRRRALVLAGITLAVALAGAAALFAFVQDPERYRSPITAMLSEAAGQPVEIAGPLGLSWRPSPTLSVRDVQVLVGGAHVTLPLVQVVVDSHALLVRKLRVRRVLVQGLRVDLDPSPAATPVSMPDFSALAVEELELRDVAVLRAGVPWFALDAVTLRDADSALGARLDLTTRIDGRDLRARARLRVAPGQIDLDALRVHLPVGVVSGHIRVALGAQRAWLSGELNADALALGARRGVGPRSLPTLPVDLSILAGVDASLRVRIGRLSLARFMVSKITAPVSLRDGNLEVKAGGVLASGPFRATLNASVPQGRFTLDLGLSGADVGNVLVMTGLTTAERGGSLALNARLRAAGADTAELLASLQGQLALDVAGLTVRAGAASLAGSGVLASLLRALQPGASDRVFIGCAVGRFQVRDGVLMADRAIGMQSRTVNLLGAGRIALPDSQVELVLRPWQRAGQAPRAVGIAGTLVIAGPLADPQVVVAGETQTRDGAALEAALSDGALSPIVRGLLERARGDAPCDQAASSAVPSRADASARGYAAVAVSAAAMRDRFNSHGSAHRNRARHSERDQ